MSTKNYSEDKIVVNIPKTKGKTGSFWVSVNGVDIEIPRGLDVLVDAKYAEVIERCLKLEEKETLTNDEVKARERERIGAASEDEVKKLEQKLLFIEQNGGSGNYTLTETDKQEIVQKVLNSIPSAEEAVF